MFQLIFGTIWTAFCSLFLYIMLDGISTGATVMENLGVGLAVISVFLIIGIVLIATGLKKIIKNIKTNKHGKEAYGIILDIYHSGSSVNGRPELKADVLVHDGFVSDVYTEIIGFNRYKYSINDYLIVKVYEGDINIVDKIDQTHIPANILKKLNEECAKKNPAFAFCNNTANYTSPNNIPVFNSSQNIPITEDTIVINGVEYVKKQENNSENNTEQKNSFANSGLNNIRF